MKKQVCRMKIVKVVEIFDDFYLLCDMILSKKVHCGEIRRLAISCTLYREISLPTMEQGKAAH